MKKLLAILLALVVVGGAFAQVTVSGYDKVSLNMNTTGASFTDGLRININGVDADKKFGFKMRFEGSANSYLAGVWTDKTGDGKADASAKNDFGVTYAYAYGTFFDGMFKLTAGKLDIYDYNLSSSASNNVLGNTANDSWSGLGFAARPAAFLAQVYPVEGLDIGIAYMPGRVALGKFEYNTTTLKNLYYGVKYGIDLLDVLYEGAWIGENFYQVRHSFSVNYKGVENLMATVGYKASYANPEWTHGAYALLGYTMDKLYVEFDTDLIVAPETYMYFEGAVEYNLGVASVRGFAAYEKDDKGIGNGNLVYSLRTYSDSVNEFQVGAEVSFPIGSGEFNVGANYADDYGWKIPAFYKIAF